MDRWMISSESWGLMSGVVICCSSFVVFLFLLKFLRGEEVEVEENVRSDFVVPRGCRGWPLIGETLEFIASGYSSNPVSFMEKRKSRYGNVFKTHLLGKSIIVSTDPDVNKMILQNQANVFTPCYPKSITELLGESSILQMNGPLHKRTHALIGTFLKSPQFKAKISKDIETAVKLTISSWKNRSGYVYLQDETKKITFEILVRMLMSVGPGEEMELLKREFKEFIKGLICLPINLPGTRLHKSLKAKKSLLQVVKKLIASRRVALVEKEDKGVPCDVMDVLLNDAGESEEETNRNIDFTSGNIIEMMIPGEETVPTAMTLAVKFLTDNPLALASLFEENMELKMRKDSCHEEYTWSDYMSLPFTQNVISETLRLANIINAVWRKSLEEVRIKGYLIPKGWCVLASFSSIHMDEINYENPHKFDPWRWKEIGSRLCSHTFTPFGGGQRLCPGLELSRLEIAIFLHHLVTTFRWVAEKDEIIYFPTVRMKRKLPITVVTLH